MVERNEELLLTAISGLLGRSVTGADYTTEVLEGGTLGEVAKLTGTAKTVSGEAPFVIVRKKQGKWERHGDPECWRREYELYSSGFPARLPAGLLIPAAHCISAGEEETVIYMDYISGRTGSAEIGIEELKRAAELLGEAQAAMRPQGGDRLPCLRQFPAVRSSADLWWIIFGKQISGHIDGFPEDIRSILFDYASRAPEILSALETLPVTVCHGDVHHDNIIIDGRGDTYLIDWDCAGYGYMGEDAVDMLCEAFVYSARDTALMPGYREEIISAYCRGARRAGMEYAMDAETVRSIFALSWGLRIAERFTLKKSEQPRCTGILTAMLKL